MKTVTNLLLMILASLVLSVAICTVIKFAWLAVLR